MKSGSAQTARYDTSILVKDRRLVIQRFETEDQDVVSYFADVEQAVLEERLATALKVGVVSLRTIGLTEKIDYVQKEFNQLSTKFDGSVQGTIQMLGQKFEDIFGEKGKVAELLSMHFGEDGKIVKEIFDPMREGSPLYELRTELQGELQKLRTDLGISEAVKEIKEKLL